MIKYVALLRGITPSNPNMRNEKLRGVFEAEGMKNVQTLISSGNVLFETHGIKNLAALERNFEKALAKNLGITSTVFIRAEKELQSLVKKDPFKNKEHTQKTYLVVTFLRNKPSEVCTVIDITKPNAQKFMNSIEKEFGKENTTRTWKTVMRILKKMEINGKINSA